MGLVMAPLMLAWVAAGAFALRMLYVLSEHSGFFPYGLLCLVGAGVLARAYVLWVQQPRRGAESLWGFQLVLDFALNRSGLFLYTLFAVLYLFNDPQVMDSRLLAVLVTGCLALPAGTLFGAVTCETFMERHNIERTF